MAGNELNGLRVLVIDDNVDAGDSIAWLLADAGAEMCVARDAIGVAALVQAFDPEMVLLDLTLPKVDGYQACRVIRQLKGDMPYIVAVTGWGGVEHRLKCVQAGFNLHLLKPVSADVLLKLGQLARLPTMEVKRSEC